MSGSPRATAVVAVHLFLLRENSVLLLRRANTGYEDGKYSVPAGHVEAGEVATDAMIRESAEEIGVMLATKDLSFALVMHRKAEAERIDFFFVARTWTGEPENRDQRSATNFAGCRWMRCQRTGCSM